MADQEVLVPNIGDFRDVPVVDVLVKPGDTVRVEDPLVELESEKATMEVPSPFAGVVRDVAVHVGDKVSEGSALLTLVANNGASEPAVASPTAASAAPAAEAPAAAAPAAAASAAATPVAASGGASAEPIPQSDAVPSAVVELRVPDIGDFTDIPIIDILVAVGDRIAREASLVTLESDKAAMDVPASAAGVVREIAVKVGDRVSQGSLIATLDAEGAATPQAPVAAPRATAAPTGGAPPSVAGVNGSAAPPPAEPSSYGASGAAPRPAESAPPPAAAPRSANGIVHASPSIRRFARELGVDLHALRGSGPHERITRDDVQNFVKNALAAPRPAPATAVAGTPFGVLPWPVVDFAKFGPVESVPLSRIRKLSGPNLHRNWVMIPHVTNNDEADITELEEFRKRVNAEQPGAKVTILAFIIKAAVVALRAHPDVNSSLDGDSLVLKKYYNIGFAADTPGGLMVPVLKGADVKGVLAIAAEMSALSGKARDGKLASGDMQGATFTISSLGGIGGTTFTPIVNAPEVAILGVSRSAIRPVWDGAGFVPRLVLPLSLSYDHRVIDGALAARFNSTLVSALSDLRRALL